MVHYIVCSAVSGKKHTQYEDYKQLPSELRPMLNTGAELGMRLGEIGFGLPNTRPSHLGQMSDLL